MIRATPVVTAVLTRISTLWLSSGSPKPGGGGCGGADISLVVSCCKSWPDTISEISHRSTGEIVVYLEVWHDTLGHDCLKYRSRLWKLGGLSWEDLVASGTRLDASEDTRTTLKLDCAAEPGPIMWFWVHYHTWSDQMKLESHVNGTTSKWDVSVTVARTDCVPVVLRNPAGINYTVLSHLWWDDDRL